MRRSHDSFLKQLYQAGLADAVRLFHEDTAIHVKWTTLQWVRTEIPILGEKPRKVISDLIRKERFELDCYGEPTLGVSYWSVGLGDLEADAYAESDNPMAWALASWMKKPRHGRARLRLGLQEKILRLVQDEPYRWLLLNTVRT